ncbi:MAG: AAA family ATPase [Methylophilus sp.]|nr:AAA family ATPase [Methylophilus sp.]
MPESSTVAISLHPEHANKILSGEKNLEFRRVWASKHVSQVIIYVTSPVQKIVAVAQVKQVHHGSPNHLWSLAKTLGGGLSRRSLYRYFEGKKQGYAIEFSSITRFNPAINPHSIFSKFHAPQSFVYVNKSDVHSINKLIMENTKKTGKNIFVVGVHGAGKSSMCEAYARKYNAKHKTASELIKQSNQDAISTGSKTVKDISGNQKLLISAVTEILSSGENLLLDGHFVLINAENKLTPLDTKVFSDLAISAVIAVYDESKSIEERVKSRDGQSLTRNLDDFQKLELSRAEEVTQELGIPFVKVKSFNQDEFESILNKMLSIIYKN